MIDGAIKYGALALTLIALAEKSAAHRGTIVALWQEAKRRKQAYDEHCLAEATVFCHGPQPDEHAIERAVSEFRRGLR